MIYVIGFVNNKGEIVYSDRIGFAREPPITRRMENLMANASLNYSGCTYEIRVKGHLEKHWLAYFSDWFIKNLENGEVLLKASNIDQAGLHGALNKIRDLNLMLLSVRQAEEEG